MREHEHIAAGRTLREKYSQEKKNKENTNTTDTLTLSLHSNTLKIPIKSLAIHDFGMRIKHWLQCKCCECRYT